MTNIRHKFQQCYISFVFLLASCLRQFRRKVSRQGKKFRNLCFATPHPPRLETTCFMKLFRPRTYTRACVIPHFLQTKPPFVFPISEKICPALLLRSFKIGTLLQHKTERLSMEGDRRPPEEWAMWRNFD